MDTDHFSPAVACIFVFGVVISLYFYVFEPLVFGKHAHIPGPKLAALSWYYLTYYDLRYVRQNMIGKWHKKYGPGWFIAFSCDKA